MAFFGDGAVNEGAFHEAVNLAAVWRLPVVFVCENNLYGFSTHYRRTMLLENIADRAAAYGIPGAVVDGMDVLAVYAAAGEAIRARTRGRRADADGVQDLPLHGPLALRAVQLPDQGGAGGVEEAGPHLLNGRAAAAARAGRRRGGASRPWRRKRRPH